MKQGRKKYWILGALFVLVIAGYSWWLSSTGGALTLPPVLNSLNEMIGIATTSTDSTGTTTPSETSGPVAGNKAAPKPSTVANVVAGISSASQFASWFANTGVAASVSGKGPYTVFVPTNGAFTLVEEGNVKGLSAAERKRLVQYHVVVGRAIDPSAVESGTIQALSRDMLNFEVRDADEIARVNSAIIVSSHKASNGVVHVINNVLLPPEQ